MPNFFSHSEDTGGAPPPSAPPGYAYGCDSHIGTAVH